MSDITKDGCFALLISVFRNVTPEEAFRILDSEVYECQKRRWTDEDIERMIRLKNEDVWWSDIALMFNTSTHTVKRVCQYYKQKEKKREQD